ncbi:MAG: hypothetical protein HQ542_13675 [Bacteroidia bacterium]|nr:hypothetical protein [Bacteroidia bacterium]
MIIVLGVMFISLNVYATNYSSYWSTIKERVQKPKNIEKRLSLKHPYRQKSALFDDWCEGSALFQKQYSKGKKTTLKKVDCCLGGLTCGFNNLGHAACLPGEDSDGDGTIDMCDQCPEDEFNDLDKDGICPKEDNCDFTYNPDQVDSDADGEGDSCDNFQLSTQECYSAARPSNLSADGKFIGFQQYVENSGTLLSNMKDNTSVSLDSPIDYLSPKSALSPDGKKWLYKIDTLNHKFYIYDIESDEVKITDFTVPEELSLCLDGSAPEEPNYNYDGTIVVFEASKSGMQNPPSVIFLYDFTSDKLEVISEGSCDNSRARKPSISWDGRYVAYVDNSDEHAQIMLFDKKTESTNVISVSPDGSLGNDYSRTPAISGNGQFVAFSSKASNIFYDTVNGGSEITSGANNLFLYNRKTGGLKLINTYPGYYLYFLNTPCSNDQEISINWNGDFIAIAKRYSHNVPFELHLHDVKAKFTKQIGYGHEASFDATGKRLAFEYTGNPAELGCEAKEPDYNGYEKYSSLVVVYDQETDNLSVVSSDKEDE